MEHPDKQNFRARFVRVLDYIDAQIDGDVSVEKLADIAAFSRFHFHRQFSSLFDLPVAQYIRLIRMRHAAYCLAYRRELQVIEIAMQAGYETPESFARAFRKIHGQSPTAFRAGPERNDWQHPYDKLRMVRSSIMPSFKPDDVTIIEFPETRTVCLDHVGPPSQIGSTIRRFIAWRKTRHLHPAQHATFNILWCNPEDTPPDRFRMGLAVATGHTPTADDREYGLYPLVLAAGRCARLRHIGSDQTLGETATRLYRDWLPHSGETPGDFPLMFQRVVFYPDVPEQDAITDIFLPLA